MKCQRIACSLLTQPLFGTGGFCWLCVTMCIVLLLKCCLKRRWLAKLERTIDTHTHTHRQRHTVKINQELIVWFCINVWFLGAACIQCQRCCVEYRIEPAMPVSFRMDQICIFVIVSSVNISDRFGLSSFTFPYIPNTPKSNLQIQFTIENWNHKHITCVILC